MSTWWDDHNENIREWLGTPGAEGVFELISARWVEVLEQVDEAFAVTGADTPGWESPRDPMDDALPEEYSRCLDPGKYRILSARAEAWETVIAERGWASPSSEIAFALKTRVQLDDVKVWRPNGAGLPLTLARTAGGTDGELPGLIIAAGEPAVELELLPDCGCDACDSGSAGMLEQLDQAVLSIIDGSLWVSVSPKSFRTRNSFGAGSHWPVEECRQAVEHSGEPWLDGWTPRSLSEPV